MKMWGSQPSSTIKQDKVNFETETETASDFGISLTQALPGWSIHIYSLVHHQLSTHRGLDMSEGNETHSVLASDVFANWLVSEWMVLLQEQLFVTSTKAPLLESSASYLLSAWAVSIIPLSSLFPLNHLMVVAGLLAMAVQLTSISSPSTAVSFWISIIKLRGGTTN